MKPCVRCQEPTDRVEFVYLGPTGNSVGGKTKQPICRDCYERYVREPKRKIRGGKPGVGKAHVDYSGQTGRDDV